jgi:DNA-binding CsgD family transcriptional regulator
LLGKLPEPLLLQLDLFVDPARATAIGVHEYALAADSTRFIADPLHIVRTVTAGVYIDAVERTRPALWRIVEKGRLDEAVTTAIQALFLIGIDDYFTGNWHELNSVAVEGLELAGERGYALTAAVGKFLLGLVHAGRGDEPEASAIAEDLLMWAAPRKLTALANYSSHIRCMTALSNSRFDDAFTHAASISPPGTLRPYVPHATWVGFDLIEAAVRSGRKDEAATHLRAMKSIELTSTSTRLRPLMLAADAMVLGGGGAAMELFEAALASEGSERWRLDRARVLLLYGEQLRRQHQPTKAMMRLEEADRIFRDIGANAWRRRTERELLAASSLDRSSGALTPQEATVAELAASGLSNKAIGEALFLSPRTVSTHLARIFRKIGISSRAGLRDALSKRRD